MSGLKRGYRSPLATLWTSATIADVFERVGDGFSR